MPHTAISVKELGVRVATNLKRIRIDQRLTQNELANRCKVTRRTISNYEEGKRNKFEGLVLLIRASQALGITLNDLLVEAP
jgi:transcriptional regulator with XRE-family HTH domain